MAKYTGLPHFKVLLLSSLLLGGTAAAEVTDDPGAAVQPAPAAEPLPADSTAPQSREAVPLRYVVKKGDTLWDISRHFLLDPWEWPEIWYVNGQLRNPHKIYPGDVLSLMVVNGRPQMVREAAANPEDRLSPRARASDLDDAIPAIPIDAIRDFLRSPRVVTPEQLKKAPYILDFVDEHLVAGAASKVYARKLPAGDVYSYSVVRLGAQYKDPDTGELLGYEAIPIGTSETQRPGDPGIALLTTTTREALVGDHFLPVEQEIFDSSIYPHAPKKDVNGRILSVFDGVSQIGQYQVIAINRGGREGLERGHVLSIMQSGRVAKDPYGSSTSRVKLPDQPAGVAMVFKVTPRISYALVMEATRPIHVLDRVVKPSRGGSR